MPLFCTLKSTSTDGTEAKFPSIKKFSNNGYPLLFEPVHKHLFYANPDDNIVNKFYCAPLSKIASNKLRRGEIIDVSAGGSFTVQERTSVNDHAITDEYKTVSIGKETSVTSTSSLFGNQSLTWGSTVNIPISIKTGGTNGHELSLNTGTLTMPANPNTDNHKATHSFLIVETDNHSGVVNEIILTNTGSNGDGSADYAHFFIEPGNNVNITKSNDQQIKISAINTHIATHGASINTSTANSPILQLTKNGSDGTETTDLWTLTGLGATIITSSSNTVTIRSTDQSVKTTSNTDTVYLSGKKTTNTSIGNEYVNSSVYMSDGSLYSKHFYATTPNTSSWGSSVAAALDIKGSDSGSQTPIFRVTSNTYGNCQLEYAERYGTMRLYRNGKYTEFPNWNIDGKIPMSTIHNTNAVNTLVHDIRVVSALPSNASSYPYTLFLVTGEEVTPEPTTEPNTVTVNIVINSGVKYIKVNGINYTRSTVEIFIKGTTINWSATAQPGYTIALPSSGSFKNISEDVTISPRSYKDDIGDITPIPTPKEKCQYDSPTRTKCYYENDPDTFAKKLCSTECGAHKYGNV